MHFLKIFVPKFCLTSHYYYYYYYLWLFLIIIWLSLFIISTGSNPGSWALMGSHVVLYFIDSTFLRMWADARRVIFCSSVTLMFPGILFVCFSMPFLITLSALMTTGTASIFILHIFVILISRWWWWWWWWWLLLLYYYCYYYHCF